jgi:hypothetical protein
MKMLDVIMPFLEPILSILFGDGQTSLKRTGIENALKKLKSEEN